MLLYWGALIFGQYPWITDQNIREIASASASACQLIIQIPEKWFNTKRERFESCVASMKSIGWIRLKVYLINWTKTNKELAVLFGERKLPLSKVIKDKGGLFFTFFTHILVAKMPACDSLTWFSMHDILCFMIGIFSPWLKVDWGDV